MESDQLIVVVFLSTIAVFASGLALGSFYFRRLLHELMDGFSTYVHALDKVNKDNVEALVDFACASHLYSNSPPGSELEIEGGVNIESSIKHMQLPVARLLHEQLELTHARLSEARDNGVKTDD